MIHYLVALCPSCLSLVSKLLHLSNADDNQKIEVNSPTYKAVPGKKGDKASRFHCVLCFFELHLFTKAKLFKISTPNEPSTPLSDAPQSPEFHEVDKEFILNRKIYNKALLAAKLFFREYKVNTPMEPEDIVSEAYVRLIEKKRKVKVQYNFEESFYSIVLSILSNELRKGEKFVPMPEDDYDAEDTPSRLTFKYINNNIVTDPRKELDECDVLGLARKAIKECNESDKYLPIFELLIDKYNNGEIADILDIDYKLICSRRKKVKSVVGGFINKEIFLN